MRPSHSLLLIYTSKLLYDKNLNNELEESIRNQFISVMYLRVPSVQDLFSELLQEIRNSVIRIMLYENSIIELCYT